MKLQSSIPLCAKDIMSRDPISVDPVATPRELARVLTDHAISGVPVVDKAARVVGVVSKTDLLQWCLKGGLGFGAANLLESLAEGGAGTRIDAIDLGIVADFMSDRLITASPDDSIADVAYRMTEHRIHRVVVVDDRGRLLGIVTTFDVLKALCCSSQGAK